MSTPKWKSTLHFVKFNFAFPKNKCHALTKQKSHNQEVFPHKAWHTEDYIMYVSVSAQTQNTTPHTFQNGWPIFLWRWVSLSSCSKGWSVLAAIYVFSKTISTFGYYKQGFWRPEKVFSKVCGTEERQMYSWFRYQWWIVTIAQAGPWIRSYLEGNTN